MEQKLICTDLPECVPMATTAPLGWKSAQCPCSWGGDRTVIQLSTANKHESSNQLSASPPVSDSTEDCDARSSRGRPAGPEHMSKIYLWTGEMPDPTAHLYDPEQIKPQRHWQLEHISSTWCHDDVIWSYLDFHKEAIIEGSSQDKVTRRSDQKLLPFTFRNSSDGSVLIWDLYMQEDMWLQALNKVLLLWTIRGFVDHFVLWRYSWL